VFYSGKMKQVVRKKI